MMRALCFVFVFVFLSFAKAQTDSSCIVQVIDKGTYEGIPFARVSVMLNGIVQQEVQTDLDGNAKISGAFAGKPYTITARCVQYQAAEIRGVVLSTKVPVKILMKPAETTLDEIVIKGYRVPMIDRDVPEKKNRRKRKTQAAVKVEKDTVHYSVKEIQDFETLRSGGWNLSDSTGFKADLHQWIGYLRKNIKYPAAALEYGIEERIYFGVTFDRSGKITKLELMRGKNPVLALAVAHLMAQCPAFVLNPAEGTPELTRIVLPVYFVLD